MFLRLLLSYRSSDMSKAHFIERPVPTAPFIWRGLGPCHASRSTALILDSPRPEDMGCATVRFVPQLDRDLPVRLEIAHPIGLLAAA